MYKRRRDTISVLDVVDSETRRPAARIELLSIGVGEYLGNFGGDECLYGGLAIFTAVSTSEASQFSSYMRRFHSITFCVIRVIFSVAPFLLLREVGSFST